MSLASPGLRSVRHRPRTSAARFPTRRGCERRRLPRDSTMYVACKHHQRQHLDKKRAKWEKRKRDKVREIRVSTKPEATRMLEPPFFSLSIVTPKAILLKAEAAASFLRDDRNSSYACSAVDRPSFSWSSPTSPLFAQNEKAGRSCKLSRFLHEPFNVRARAHTYTHTHEHTHTHLVKSCFSRV